MKTCLLVLLVLTAVIVAVATVKPRPLFDGKSFAGWEGNLKIFHIEDGAIIGGSMKAALPNNEFLCTTKRYSDFVLRARFKVAGERVNASGRVQSKYVPKVKRASVKMPVNY